MKSLLVLRPEPGNSATAERARALGLQPLQRPLFAVEKVDWKAPDPAAYDYLLLTSANVIRFGGRQLMLLKDLPVLAVGPATASAASEAGLSVKRIGSGGVEELLASLPGRMRLLHLTGADHHHPTSDHEIEPLIAYRAAPLNAAIPQGKFVALVHSARAGAQLSELANGRADLAIVAISDAAAAACGSGWAALAVAERPDDAALLALAARLCQD
jgi:uroporphyrinogen-III synthase